MNATIWVSADPVWTDPSIQGLEVSDAEWHLDVARYRHFIEEAAGIDPTDPISTAACYRIGNRLQALVEDHKRNDEWEPALVEEYPDVASLEGFLWVARIFQRCHECADAGQLCLSPEHSDEVCGSTK